MEDIKMTYEQVNQLPTKELVQRLNDCLLAIHFLCGGRHEIIEKDKNLKKAFDYLLAIGAINYALRQRFVDNEEGENNGRAKILHSQQKAHAP